MGHEEETLRPLLCMLFSPGTGQMHDCASAWEAQSPSELLLQLVYIHRGDGIHETYSYSSL